LAMAARESVWEIPCTCKKKERCEFIYGWVNATSKSKRSCKLYRVWNAIGDALHHGLLSIFINAGQNATIRPPYLKHDNFTIKFIHNAVLTKEQPQPANLDCKILHSSLMSLIQPGPDTAAIALSSMASTIYPGPLRILQVSTVTGAHYDLVEGALVLEGRYHTRLACAIVSVRPISKKSLRTPSQRIVPSSAGAHSDLEITLRECLDFLELRCTARVGGVNVHLDLGRVICASLGLETTEPCEHPAITPLEFRYEPQIMTTSVVSPCALGKKVALAQTENNSTAQLLCCEFGVRVMLQKDCCLNCALLQAKERDCGMIITG